MARSPAEKKDAEVYRLAQAFLLGLDGVTRPMLDEYLSESEGADVRTLPTVYGWLLYSAQNAQMKANVIGGAIGGVDSLRGVLCGFKPRSVVSTYGSDSERLLDDIVKQVKPAGAVRTTPKSCWPQFCMAALSAARFLQQFRGWADFDGWVRTFDDDRSRAALPMLLSHEVHGIGFSLACGFLKDLGYHGYCKPDVHLKKTFAALQLSPSNRDYDVFKAVVRMARHVRETPFRVDRVFWLIGSGKFYLHEMRTGHRRDEFIRWVREQLGE